MVAAPGDGQILPKIRGDGTGRVPDVRRSGMARAGHGRTGQDEMPGPATPR